jgi:hypothetical protein
VLVAGSFAGVLAILYRLTCRLGASRNGARVAVLALAFYPRNREVLFWFAAWQDLVTGACVLLAALFFLDFRESKRIRSLVFAASAYFVALGFKETTVVIPFLLLIVDFYRERSLGPFKKAAFWRAYLPFAGILLLYVGYFFSDSGVASLAGHRTAGYYGFHGLFGILKGLIRALISIALPFVTPAPLGLEDIRWRHVAMLSIEVLLLLLLVWKARAWPALSLALGWLIVTILPTAAFAAYFNADRYLFVPLTGAAVFMGLLVESLVRARPRASAVVWIALASYCCAGGLLLVQGDRIWRGAGKEAAMVVSRTVQSASRLPRGSEIDLVNVTQHLTPYYTIPVFANGLADALAGNGLPSSVRVLVNFTQTSAAQRFLMKKLGACTGSTADDSGNRIILVVINHRPVQARTSCAAPLVDGDRAEHPQDWSFLDFNQ